MMKALNVRKIEFATEYPTIEAISKKFDKLNIRNQIEEINWKDFDYKPEAAFSVGYTEKELLLKYYVTEQYFKAEKTESNQMVCEDSCVEFFVSPCDDGIYYNFEFNGIGTCLLGTGTRRENSTKTDPEIIAKIRRVASAGIKPVKETKGKFSWTITIAIPQNVFFLHEIKKIKGQIFRANFYKCGDKLTVPHYVTWNRVETQKPDFHRPEYFGSLRFI
jgi:hypothetical protein